MSDKSFCTVFLIKYRFWGLKRLDFNNFITVSNKRSIVHHEIKNLRIIYLTLAEIPT